MDLQEWQDATHNTVELWGDGDLERVSLITNLERLKVRLSYLIKVLFGIDKIFYSCHLKLFFF